MIGRRSHLDAQSLEDALNGATPRDEHIADLVRLAEGICEAAAAEPSTSFRESLRTQLMTEAATTLVALPPEPRPTASAPTKRSGRRRLATVTAALVVVGGGAGLVTSSASAVPGDMLYPVKRTVETVELQLHRNDSSRGSFQLGRAAERLAEARELNAGGGSTALLAETLDDFAATAEDGSSKLFSEFTATGEEEPIRKVNDFVASSSADLSDLSAALPVGAADAFAAAKASITDLASEASTLCRSCAPADGARLVDRIKAPANEPAAKHPAKRESGPVGSGVAPTTKPSTPVVPQPAASSSAPKSAAPATPKTPAPRPTPTAPSLSDITDPLLGGLLGNEEQEGLVPGLLDGLLGGGTTKP